MFAECPESALEEFDEKIELSSKLAPVQATLGLV